ncbi:hypothetical protein BpHYR1_012969 [Brachionus plicatilis]|uniref:Uncharacterized protein n=1 Tax=Brachionus plicatilis TaxID=10195 RepID=A0A3M7RBV6_BRAPC|nr:hypothetical protein BpHYR1_012969 [Brachionus plicatilis]
MRHLCQNFDINCSIFSRSVSGKKSGLNAALKSRILNIKIEPELYLYPTFATFGEKKTTFGRP